MSFHVDPTITAAALVAEGRPQLERAHRLIADSRFLREQTEATLAQSRQLLSEVSRVLHRQASTREMSTRLADAPLRVAVLNGAQRADR